MLSIERLLVLVEQYIITVEVRSPTCMVPKLLYSLILLLCSLKKKQPAPLFKLSTGMVSTSLVVGLP